MTQIKLYCTGGSARAYVNGTLTDGMVGVVCCVNFDSQWDGLTPRVIASANGIDKIAVISDGMCIIPWECMIGGAELKIGVDGWSGNILRTPTEWASCGIVKNSVAKAANEAESSVPAPSPSVIQQIEAQAYFANQAAENAVAEVEALKQRADSGEFKGDRGDPGRDGVDGYTPQKGIDYFDGKDGKTPVKGVDYFDGEPGYTPRKGIDYFDGKTPVKGVDYFDGKDGAPGKDGIDGYTPRKNIDYFDGKDGEPGKDGDDYILTDTDKLQIANIAAEIIAPQIGAIAEAVKTLADIAEEVCK